MALITDYLKVSDALKKDREGVFDLMDDRFDRFKIQSDGLRNMYLDNQRVPEELSKTRLNDFNNTFNLESRQQNRDYLMETARLNAEFGLKDSRFNNDNQSLTQERDKLGIENDIYTRKNKILEEQGRRELLELVANSPNNSDTDIITYHDNLLRKAETPEAKTAIRAKVLTEYKPELDLMSSIPDAFDDISTGNEKTRAARATNLKSSIDRHIESGTFKALQRLYDSGYMNRSQKVQYEQMVKILTTYGDGIYTIEDLTQQTPLVPATTPPVPVDPASPVGPTGSVVEPQPLPLPDGVERPITPHPVPIEQADLLAIPDLPDAPDVDDNISIINEINSVDLGQLNPSERSTVTEELIEYRGSDDFRGLMSATKDKIDAKINEAAEIELAVSSEIESHEERIIETTQYIDELKLQYSSNNPSNPNIMDNPQASELIVELEKRINDSTARLNELKGLNNLEPEVTSATSESRNNPLPYDSTLIDNQLPLDKIERNIQNNEPLFMGNLEPEVADMMRQHFTLDVLQMLSESEYSKQRDEIIADIRLSVKQ